MKVKTMPIERRRGIAGRHIVSCGQPAQGRHNALVTGNGTLMLSCMGEPEHETLVLEREELMSPQWHEPPKAPLIRDYLSDVRRAILDGDPQGGAELADMAAAQHGTPATLQGNPSHPALVLHIDQDVRFADDYLNTLDMRTSLITTRWNDGGEFKRELFASRADGIAAVRLTAPEGRLNALIRGEFPELRYVRGTWSANDLPAHSSSKKGPGFVPEDFANTGAVGRTGMFDCLPVAPDVTLEHCGRGITVEGMYAYEVGGFTAAVRLYVQGGSAALEEGGLRISGADSAVLLLGARRNYGTQPAGDGMALMGELEALGCDFDALHARHAAIHRPMFDRVEADLGGDADDYLLTTVELKRKQFTAHGIVPAYMEAMLDMGRYFLLNESGKFPPIYGHVNVNVNHQISGGNIGSLPEMMESFFRWIEWQLPAARENAQRILGARGFFIACHPDQESGNLLHFSEFWPHHYWISSSGWCLNPFLEHYYCTGDEDFLKNRLLPLYHELALLYEDFLTVRDENGKLMFIPSYSPENFPSNVASMMNINAVMDISVCREVLKVLIELGPRADMFEPEEYDKWQRMLDDLPDYLIGEHGELKEWAWSEFEERFDHRHASHLYGAYPGDEIQPELDHDLYEAAFIANRMRALGNESCHGIMHRAQAAARLKDEWLVQKLMRFALEAGYVNDNFTTAHNPYFKHCFPDGQGALPTVLIESLLYSRPGVLEPLPARPRGSFVRGELRGVSARTACRVDSLRWDMRAGTIEIEFTPLKAQSLEIMYRAGFESIEAEGAELKPGAYEYSRRLEVAEGVKCRVKIAGAGGRE